MGNFGVNSRFGITGNLHNAIYEDNIIKVYSIQKCSTNPGLFRHLDGHMSVNGGGRIEYTQLRNLMDYYYGGFLKQVFILRVMLIIDLIR